MLFFFHSYTSVVVRLKVLVGIVFIIIATLCGGSNGSSPKLTLHICSVIEGGDINLVYNYQRAAAAIDMAIEHANEVILPPDIRLKFHYKDGGDVCASNHRAVSSALDWMKEGISCNIYLGPGCDRAAADLYRVADYLKVPLIGCPASNIDGNTALADENNQFFFEFGDALIQRFRKDRRDLYKGTKILQFRSDEATAAQYANLLSDASKQSRVIFFFANATIVRNLMLHAWDIDMTSGGYVYIAVELFKSNFWGEMTWKFGDIRDGDAKLAYRSLALISLYENHNQFFSGFSKEVRTRSREIYNFTYGAFEDVDPIVTSFYDAIILYASTVEKVHSEGDNVTDGPLMAQAMRNSTFPSPLGYPINMDADGDRSYAYTVKQLSGETGKFDDILRIDYHSMLETWYGKFKWPGIDGLPPDTPRCGFDGTSLICALDTGIANQPGTIAGLSIAVILTVIGISVGLFFWIDINYKGSYRSRDPYWWRIRLEEVQYVTSFKGGKLPSPNAGKSVVSLRTYINSTATVRAASGSVQHNSRYSTGLVAIYMGNPVTLVELPEQMYKTTANLIKELNQIRTLNHMNVHRLVGLCLDDHNYCEYIVTEVCSKGSLDKVLGNELVNLDWSFKHSIIKDLTEGMNYLHDSIIVSHGFLTGFNCLIDSRFLVKIANYGITTFVKPEDLLPPEKRDDDVDRNFTLLLWRAPELMRQTMAPRGTQKGDVYSFAIMLQQIILRSAPYSASNIDNQTGLYNNQGSHKEIVLEVKEGSIPPMRPNVPRAACSPELYQLMEQCWSEFPSDRPPFVKIKDFATKIVGKGSSNIVEHLLERMELYANSLEEQVAVKTRMFMEEKSRSEELLSQLLPKVIAEALTKGENVVPESYESVSIYFSDIVGFTTICATIPPMDVVMLLNNLYTLFDGILGNYDVYKVETIGDAYMVASGLPIRNGKRHASEIALVSLHIRRDIAMFEVPNKLSEKLQIRIGIHSGSCVAGIVGHKMPRYCLFGDTVNVASRMESTGEAMKIQTSEKTQDLLEKIGGFAFQLRGEIPVKGKGTMKTYWLLGLGDDGGAISAKKLTSPLVVSLPA